MWAQANNQSSAIHFATRELEKDRDVWTMEAKTKTTSEEAHTHAIVAAVDLWLKVAVDIILAKVALTHRNHRSSCYNFFNFSSTLFITEACISYAPTKRDNRSATHAQHNYRVSECEWSHKAEHIWLQFVIYFRYSVMRCTSSVWRRQM